jgi:hypothetical protein
MPTCARLGKKAVQAKTWLRHEIQTLRREAKKDSPWQEVAVILERFTSNGDAEYSIDNILDAGSIASWALSGVKKAFSLGYINGDNLGMFNPLNPLKRCEAVKIINRVLGLTAVGTGGSGSGSSTGSSTGTGSTTDSNTNTGSSSTNTGSTTNSISITNFRQTNLDLNEMTFSATTNKDGILYYVLIPDSNSSTPTDDQIIAGMDRNNNRLSNNFGDFNIYSSQATTRRLTGLTSDESYKLCAVAIDSSGNRSSVQHIIFRTKSEGDSGSEWLGSTFKIASNTLSSDGAEFTYRSTRAGTLYWVVVSGSSPSTPSQDRIRNGRDSSGSYGEAHDERTATANSQDTFGVSGLSSGTDYRIFACVYDSSGNYSIVKSVSFKTTSTSSGSSSWFSTFTQDTLTDSSAKFNATFGTYGSNYRFYWMVVESSASVPNPTQIYNRTYGTGSNNTTNNAKIVDSGGGESSIPSSRSMTASVAGLSPSTTYRIYGTVRYSTSSSSSATYSTPARYVSFTTPAQSNSVANLVSLVLSYHNGSAFVSFPASSGFTFLPGTYVYSNVSVPATTQLQLKVKTAALTTARLEGGLIASPNNELGTNGNETTVTIPVTQGINTLNVVVKQETKTEKIYTIIINVQEPTKAKLDTLTINDSDGVGFDKNRYDYPSVMVTSKPSIDMIAIPESGTTIQEVVSDGPQPVVSAGNNSYTIYLNEGNVDTNVTVTVKKSGVVDGEYKLTLKRKS